MGKCFGKAPAKKAQIKDDPNNISRSEPQENGKADASLRMSFLSATLWD